MKPNFALTLSFEGVGLLHRNFPGWTSVGEVSLDSTDLAGDLERLRAHAENVAGKEIRCKLVLPNDQVKYLRLPTEETDPDACARLAREALNDATPYAVEDLAYDWSLGDGAVLVAAVARDTLHEAENFAAEHGFQPFSFVATPENGSFAGEPYFGKTRHARAMLAEEDEILRDPAPIRVIGSARPPQQEMPAPAETPAPEAESEPDPAPIPHGEEMEGADAPSAWEQGSADQQEQSAPPEPESFVEPTLAEEPVAQDPEPLPEAEAQEPEPPRALAEPEELVAADEAPPRAEESSPLEEQEAQEFPPSEEQETQEPLPADENQSAALGFASIRARRDVPAPDGLRPLSGVARGGNRPDAPESTGGDARANVPSDEPALTSASIPPDDDKLPVPPRINAGAREPVLSRHGDAPRPQDPVQAEAERMTIFGARQSDATVRGKPRHLALILTAILVMFLATVAAWAALFMDDGIAGLFGPRQEESFQITGTELLHDEALAVEGEEAMVPEADIEEAALLPVQEDETATADTSGTSEPPLTETEATRRYAVSGIWQLAPQTPDAPAPHTLEDLYVASIDSAIPVSDAVALPAGDAPLTDIAPPRPGNPAPAGTRFDLDQRGLVVASAEGALTPDGITVYAGLPPLIPAALPDRSESNRRQSINEATENDRLSGFRPRPRPENLEEENERSNLGGLSREELAAFRPRPRPADIATQAEQARDTPTGGIAASPKPAPRPKNFASAVENAIKQAGSADNSQPTQVAAARAVVPAVPSSASVAKQATVRNAIRLRQINLIGVYGKTSNRRALVRLSNGRYQKVQVGDRIDGGRVTAIGDGELLYSKRGKNIVLRLPKD